MRLSLLAALVSALAAPLSAQGTPSAAPASEDRNQAVPFDKAEAHEAVRALALRLEADFVFPDAARAYAERLRARLASGAYDRFGDSQDFAAAVTADLQAVHPDRHLRLIAPKLAAGGERQARTGLPRGNQVSRSGWLAPGVAYIAFDSFPGNVETLDAIRRFLADHRGADSLIVDARTHRGGGLSEMDLLFPQLFTSPTVLVGMDTRTAVDERMGDSGGSEEWSLRTVDGPEGVVRREHFVAPAADGPAFGKARIFLLTSGRTASAGEHLSLSLKRTGRATLIGETTRGAGHYGGTVELPHGFSAFIPVGRTFDPDTGLGWEAVGVRPHVEVPADKALDEALRLAGASVSAEAALASLD